MESIILYGSRYGATRRYALALSERTGIPACSYRDKPDLSGKTLVVYLGGLYAGGVLGLAKTLRRFSLQAPALQYIRRRKGPLLPERPQSIEGDI